MKRHTLSTRVWHWLTVVCTVVLFMSGLTISNAHPWLYWGQWGFEPADAWLAVPRFPDWLTIPGYYSLAKARSWHVFTAWPFALALLLGWLAMLANGHFKHDIATTRREWTLAAIKADLAAHLRLDLTHGGGHYNFLQKLSYGLVLGVLLPGLVLTGVAISPGSGPGFGWMIELMGGRQSARSLHFICAFGLLAFVIVHVVLVLLTGPWGQIRAMVTGGQRQP